VFAGDYSAMSTPQPPDKWLSQLSNWTKGTIATVTSIVGFVLLVRANYHLSIVAFISVLLAACCYGFIHLFTRRNVDENGQPTSTYRYDPYRPWALLGLGITLLAVVLLLIAPPSRSFVTIALVGTPIPTSTPAATATPLVVATATPLAFATATPDETLILIARFHNTTAINTEPEIKIRRRIEGELGQLRGTQVRVAVEPTVLTADARVAAESLGRLYQASMVIWGEDTGVEMVVNYLNLLQPHLEAAQALIVERERSQWVNPDAYAHFITEDLPGQLSFLALFAVAQSYDASGDYAQAIEILERAVYSSSGAVRSVDLAAAYFRLGWLYQQPTINDLDNAIESYSQTIELDPRYVYAYYNRGNAYYNQGEMERAIADYDQVILLDPEYADAYYNRGNTYADQGELAQAIADYDQVIQLAPGYVNAYYNRGNAYAARGEWAQAIADYDQVIQLAPDCVNAYYNRGNTYAAQEKWAHAIEDYNRVVQLDPGYVYAYYNRGNAYAAQDEWEQAMASYDGAIRLNPNDANLNNLLCRAYGLHLQPEIALPYCNQAIELDPHPSYFDSRGLVYALLDDYDAAIADFQMLMDALETQSEPDLSAYIELRQAWIEALMRGVNPITPEVVAALRQE
jgi:tetratricopeptide (TPR) repeat protein